MIANLWMGFDDRARPNAEPPPGQDPGGQPFPPNHPVWYQLGDEKTRKIFRVDNPNGPRDRELWSLYYDVDDAVAVGGGFHSQDLLQARDALNADFPGQLRTVGAWWFDTGQQVMNPAGTQVQFTLDSKILEYIPDIVTYIQGPDDPDGFPTVIEDTRERPTVVTDVNLGFGQAFRDFS